jgi:hypothetical protein
MFVVDTNILIYGASPNQRLTVRLRRPLGAAFPVRMTEAE